MHMHPPLPLWPKMSTVQSRQAHRLHSCRVGSTVVVTVWLHQPEQKDGDEEKSDDDEGQRTDGE